MAITIREIASLAGVSISTVSYVINGKGRISNEVKERVLKIIEEQGYKPTNAARNLVMEKNFRIAIIIPDADYLKSSIFFNNISSGIIRYITSYKNDLVIQVKEKSYHRWLQSAMGADGAIILNPESGDKYMNWLKSGKIPFVLIGSLDGEEYKYINSVDADIGSIAYKAMNAFIESGHRNVLCNLGLKKYTFTQNHMRFVKQAIVDSKLRVNDYYMHTDYVLDDDPAQLESMIKEHPKITGVICASDVQALNVKVQASKLGLKIPQDLSLMCLSGTYLTKYTSPRITSFYTSYEEMGRISAEMLMTLINGMETGAPVHKKLNFTYDHGETFR